MGFDMATGKIIVELPTNRWANGKIWVENENGETIAGPFDARGKSSDKIAKNKGNPARVSTQKYGDTPTGGYVVRAVTATGTGTHFPESSFGPYGAIAMEGAFGDAADAVFNGRTGIMIHGGPPSANGNLKSTAGCVRVSNADMKALMEAAARLINDEIEMTCSLKISVIVSEPTDGDDSSIEASDPPPYIELLLKGHQPPPLPQAPAPRKGGSARRGGRGGDDHDVTDKPGYGNGGGSDNGGGNGGVGPGPPR